MPNEEHYIVDVCLHVLGSKNIWYWGTLHKNDPIPIASSI